MHRKGWGTCRSPKSYNLSLDCPPCLVLFKMADKISVSQRYISASTPKSNEPAIYLSQRYIPNNVTLKKRQKPSAFYDRCPAFGWALVKKNPRRTWLFACLALYCIWHYVILKRVALLQLIMLFEWPCQGRVTLWVCPRGKKGAKTPHECMLFFRSDDKMWKWPAVKIKKKIAWVA